MRMEMRHDLTASVRLLLSYFFFLLPFCDALLRCYDGPARNQTGCSGGLAFAASWGDSLCIEFYMIPMIGNVDYLG